MDNRESVAMSTDDEGMTSGGGMNRYSGGVFMNEDTTAGEETGEEEGQYVFSESYDDKEAEIRKLLWYHIERTKKYVMRHILKIGDVASRVTIMENIFRLLFTHASDRKMNVESSTTADGNGNEHEDSRLLRKRKKNNRRKKRGSSSGNDEGNNHGHQQHSDSKAIDLQQSIQSSVDGASSAAALAVEATTTSSTASVSSTPVSPSTSLHSSSSFSPSSPSSPSSSTFENEIYIDGQGREQVFRYMYISDAHLSTVVLEILNKCLHRTLTETPPQESTSKQQPEQKETKDDETRGPSKNSLERAKKLHRFVEEGIERLNVIEASKKEGLIISAFFKYSSAISVLFKFP